MVGGFFFFFVVHLLFGLLAVAAIGNGGVM